MSILKKGLKGAPVKRMQEALGVAADGDFGPGTEAALKAFQKSKGLAVDGIAGPDTFAAMGLHELVLLRVGSRGEQVKKMQDSLGIDADGKFGPGTKKAVEDYQKANGLTVDGMAGPATLSQMASFSAVITPEVIKKAEVKPEEEVFESEPLPEISGVEVNVASAAPAVETKSVWGKIKGWF